MRAGRYVTPFTNDDLKKKINRDIFNYFWRNVALVLVKSKILKITRSFVLNHAYLILSSSVYINPK